MMREYTVFNVAQCENLPDRVMTLGEIKVRNKDERDATIDEFLACSGVEIRESAGEAYYRPSDDFISLPRFEAFKSAANFYAVAFHELGHATGHKSRLGRDLRHRFGQRAYAAEELVAELCAAFLCAEFSLDGDLRHSGYIQSWIGLLKADSRAARQIEPVGAGNDMQQCFVTCCRQVLVFMGPGETLLQRRDQQCVVLAVVCHVCCSDPCLRLCCLRPISGSAGPGSSIQLDGLGCGNRRLFSVARSFQ
jgi:hypothetical protein